MKMLPAHYEHMNTAMQSIMASTPFSVYAEQGLSGKRYRWDCCRAAGLISFVCDTLYAYLDDTHIDTALRRITRTA